MWEGLRYESTKDEASEAAWEATEETVDAAEDDCLVS